MTVVETHDRSMKMRKAHDKSIAIMCNHAGILCGPLQ